MIGYERLRTYAALKAADDRAKLDDFLSATAQERLATIAAIAGRSLKLTIVPPEFKGANQAWSQAPASIFLGLVLLRNLDDACLAFANLLTRNYYGQQLGFVPSLPLPILIGAREFPAAALELYVANMLPKAADPTGHVRSDFESGMASLQFAGGSSFSVSDLRKLHGRMPKRFGVALRNDASDDRAPLRGEPFPHVLFMYERLLCDTVALILAHEASHIVLGHVDAPPSRSQRSRELEVEADAHAIGLLGDSGDFNLRSATLLFAFLQAVDRTTPLEDLTHPFAADRLAVLAGSLGPATGERFVADVNAGFQLLRKPLEVSVPPLSDGVEQSVEGWASSDLYYGTTLSVNIRRKGAIDASETPSPNWELTATLRLRDRVNPAVVRRSGTASVHFSRADYSGSISANERVDTFTFHLEAPPSWWLDVDGAVLEVAHASARQLAGKTPSREDAPGARFAAETLAEAALRSTFEALVVESPRKAVLAAHRAIEAEPRTLAVAFLNEARAKLGDRDLRAASWLAKTSIDGGNVAAAVDCLRETAASVAYVPGEIRLQLAEAMWQRFRELVPRRPPFWKPLSGEAARLYDGAYDVALQAVNLVSDDESRERATMLIVAMTRDYAPTRTVSSLLEAMRGHAAGMQRVENDRAAAAAFFAKAVTACEAALRNVDYRPAMALHLAGEAAVGRAVTTDRDFTQAIGYFERMAAADFSFVPAFTELAKIGLELKDYASVGRALAKADAIMPNHPFLENVRREYDRRISVIVEEHASAASQALDVGDTSAARAAAVELSRVASDLPDSINLQAVTSYYAGDLTAAREAMRAYMGREGQALHAMAMLGQMELESGAYHEAWETLSMALGFAEHQLKREDLTGPSTPVIPYSGLKERSFARAARAVALSRLGECERARAEASEAARGFTSGALCLLDCAEALRLAGEAESARDLVQAALAAEELPLPAQLKRNAQSFLSGYSGSLLSHAR